MNRSSSTVALVLLFGFVLVFCFPALAPAIAQQPPLMPQQNAQTPAANASTTSSSSSSPGPTGFPPFPAAATANETAATNATTTTTLPPTTQQPTAANTNATGSLSTQGLISSFILSTGQPEPAAASANATGGGNATNATAPAPVPAESLLPYILGGAWNMNANNGNVTSFDSNFTMVHTDGTEKHTHEITNFVSNPDNAPFQPNTNETALVLGKSNIETNGSPKWNNVDTTLILDKLSTLSIIVDSNATDNHFKNQPIYGIVTSPASQSNATTPTG